MRSNRFFILHVLFNTILMFCVSSFLFTTSENLDSNSDDALVIPQILGVVPGQDPGQQDDNDECLTELFTGLAFSIGYCLTLHDSYSQSGDSESCCRTCCGRYSLIIENDCLLLTFKTSSIHFRLQKSAKMILATVFIVFGYLFLVPSLFWTFLYKWFTSFDDDVKMVMTKYASKE